MRPDPDGGGPLWAGAQAFGMPVSALAFAQSQVETPDTGIGAEELVDFWPIVVRAAWFLGTLLVVVLLGWYVLEPAIGRIVRRRNRDNPTIQEAISRYVRLAVFLVGTLAGAVVAGYGAFVGGSALVVAAFTVVVGVAGQTVIGSLVSGVVLVSDPEFNLGNYIQWEGGEGTVESITLRVTRVRTPAEELVTIPNTELTGGAVTRPYAHDQFRVVEKVGLSYDDDEGTAIHHMQAAAGEIEGILAEPMPRAFVDEFGGDAVIYRVHYWVDDPRNRNLFEIRSQYGRALKDRLDGEGITISPPSKRDLEGGIEVERSG